MGRHDVCIELGIIFDGSTLRRLKPPFGAPGRVFQGHAESRQPVPNLVRHGELTPFTKIRSRLNKELDEGGDVLLIRRGVILEGEAQYDAQLTEERP